MYSICITSISQYIDVEKSIIDIWYVIKRKKEKKVKNYIWKGQVGQHDGSIWQSGTMARQAVSLGIARPAHLGHVSLAMGQNGCPGPLVSLALVSLSNKMITFWHKTSDVLYFYQLYFIFPIWFSLIFYFSAIYKITLL